MNTSNVDEIKTLHVEMELHKKKADWFYKLKRQASQNAKKHNYFEAIATDFGKNLPVPNLSTNNVYYRRQLSFYSFNIHILLNGHSNFYTYDKTVG